MAVTEMTPETEPEAPAPPTAAASPGEFELLVGSGDHTSIGRLYIGFSLVFLIGALVARLVVGIDVATDGSLLGNRAPMLATSTLVALVFLGVVPLLLGLAIHMVPLQIGSPAIAFPRATALSLWSWLVFAVIFVTSVAVDGGIGGADERAARLGNVSLAAMMVALALGAVCVATTVMTHRPAGMTLARVPLFSWSMLLASVIWIVSFGAAIAHSVIGHIAAGAADSYLENFTTGLAWLVRGPAVFMLAIPVLGIAGDAVATATHRPLKRYGTFQGLIGAYAILSFGAWAQVPASINTALWALFALAIAVPVLGLLGGLAESMRYGKVPLNAVVIGSLLALVNLLGAALVGVVMALDTAGTGNLFNVSPVLLAEAQAVFVLAAAVAGALAGLAHWSVKVWGSEADDTTLKAAIGMVDVGGFILALTLAVQVLVQAGHEGRGHVVFGLLAATGALLLVVGVIGALLGSLGAAREGGGDAAEDPYDGLTLEWQTPSPAVGAERTADLVPVGSPYPLFDLKEGN